MISSLTARDFLPFYDMLFPPEPEPEIEPELTMYQQLSNFVTCACQKPKPRTPPEAWYWQWGRWLIGMPPPQRDPAEVEREMRQLILCVLSRVMMAFIIFFALLFFLYFLRKHGKNILVKWSHMILYVFNADDRLAKQAERLEFLQNLTVPAVEFGKGDHLEKELRKMENDQINNHIRALQMTYASYCNVSDKLTQLAQNALHTTEARPHPLSPAQPEEMASGRLASGGRDMDADTEQIGDSSKFGFRSYKN